MSDTHDEAADVRDWRDIARLLDHALLHPTMTPADMKAALEGLKDWPLASVCIKPSAVALCKAVLDSGEGGVATGTVIGFPAGSNRPDVKAFETQRAIADGAGEVDMVVNVGAVLGGEWDAVRDDIAAVLEAVRDGGALLKVIFETDYVTAEADKVRLCEVCTELGVDFVKTSTGFGFTKQPGGGMGYTGATEADLKLMRKHSGDAVGVKASGGVRTVDDCLMCIAAGCTRIGTGSSEAILKEAVQRYGGELPAGGASGEGY